MSINGISIGEILADAAPDNATVEWGGAQGADFAALLFLMLTAPAANNPPLTAVAESSVAIEANEVGANAEISGYPSAGDVTLDKPLLNSFSGESDGSAVAISETSLDQATGTAFTSEAPFWQGSRPEPAPALHDIAKFSSPRRSGVNDEGLIAAPRDQWTSSKNPLATGRGLNAIVMAEPQGGTVMVPKEHFPSNDLPIATNLMHLSAKNTSNEVVPPETIAGAGELPFVLEIEAPEAHPGLPGYSAGANEIADQTNSQPLRELKAGSERREDVGKFMGSGANLRQPLSAVSAEHAKGVDVASKLAQQPRPDAEGELNESVLPGAVESPGQFHSLDARQENRGFSSQHFSNQRNGGELSRDPFEVTAEAVIGIAPHDAVPFPVAHARDKAPITESRESHAMDWRPVIDRIVGEISGRIRIDRQEAVLQLDPPQLGKVHIDLHIDGDKLAARILTETQESRMLIEAHLSELRQALGENRVELVDIRVDSAGSWTGPRGDGQHLPQQHTSGGPQTARNFNESAPDNSPEGEPARRTLTLFQTGRVSIRA